jgi:tripartite-type tricarboxylate transporter receptor subunit TctC
MKSTLARGLGFALLTVCTSLAAQDYPARPVRLVVPFAPGGGTDIIGRLIAQRLTENWGQTVVVDNRAGAGGVIGAELVAKAQPDGYTLLMGTPGPLTINPNLMKAMPYQTLRDFTPISLATISPFMLVVHPALPAHSAKELVALAKSRPGALNYGSAGNGSVGHLAGEQFAALAGIKFVHVPYKGSSLAVTDLLAGQLQFMLENLPTVLPHVKAGKLRALAVGTKHRSGLVPEYPPLSEAGVPGYEASTAFGVLGPARMPAAVLSRLNRDIVRVLKGADVKERLSGQGVEAVGSTPEQYATHLREELQRYARIVKSASIRPE